MSIKEKLKTILATNDFNQLAQYAEPLSWGKMSLEEREMLSLLFVKQGEHQLKSGEGKVLHSFDLATKIAPSSPIVFFTQALVYAGQGQNIRCLMEAVKVLEKATDLDPSFVGAWHSWGNVLLRMGLLNDSMADFYQADEKFSKTASLIEQHKDHEGHLAALLWHWAVCWFQIGKHSGEAVDFSKALEKFRLAEARGCDSGDFHNDYGNALVDLGCLLGRKELFEDAISHYKKLIEYHPNQYEGWLNLACTYQRLYDFNSEKSFFHEADEAFERAVSLNSEDASVWLRWGELYTNSGKYNRDIERVVASFDKFVKASALEPQSANVLLRWGEAQMLVAMYNEDLNQLRDAERKIKIAAESARDEPDAWYVYGLCLNEFGRYFSAEQYYYQAIEKFQYGLSLSASHPLLLHGMALSHFYIGEMSDDVLMIEQSLRFFARLEEVEDTLVSQVLSDWGVSLMKLGEMTNEKIYIEAAAEKFERAINQRIDHANGEDVEFEWLYNYGCAMDFLGDFHEESTYYEKAIQVLSHIVKADPEHHHARYHLALALFHLGELNDEVENFHHAIDLFQELVEADPEDEMAWNDYGLTLLNLAVLTVDGLHLGHNQHLFDQAENKLLQAVSLGNLYAYYNLACLYALKGNPSAAVHYLERAEVADVLPALADVLHDEWLESLQGQPLFSEFVSRLITKRKDNPDL